MARSALTTRDKGFALVGQLNRWLVAGAIALSGGISVAAANAFHGRTRGQTVSHRSASGAGGASGGDANGSGGSSSSSRGGSSASGAGGLQPPAQAPAPAPAAPSGGVVSGGS